MMNRNSRFSLLLYNHMFNAYDNRDNSNIDGNKGTILNVHTEMLIK